jgi:hypothetical protein
MDSEENHTQKRKGPVNYYFTGRCINGRSGT